MNALELANELFDGLPKDLLETPLAYDAAAELRRLHAINAELVEALDKVLNTRFANEIVGRDVDGHPLNALGVARKHAYELVKKAKQ